MNLRNENRGKNFMVEWSKVNDLRNGKWGENLKFEIGDGVEHPSMSAILGVELK